MAGCSIIGLFQRRSNHVPEKFIGTTRQAIFVPIRSKATPLNRRQASYQTFTRPIRLSFQKNKKTRKTQGGKASVRKPEN